MPAKKQVPGSRFASFPVLTEFTKSGKRGILFVLKNLSRVHINKHFPLSLGDGILYRDKQLTISSGCSRDTLGADQLIGA